MSDRSKFDIELPQSIIDSFARHLVSEIRKYYDSDESQATFEEWLKQQEDSQDAQDDKKRAKVSKTLPLFFCFDIRIELQWQNRL